MTESISSKDFFQLTIQIISSYVSKHKTDIDTLPELIRLVSYGLSHADKKHFLSKPLNPPVPISETVTEDYIICLEDGRKLKMLKRHLRTAYKMSIEDYKEKWGLPANYPVVAPSYAKRRSQIAKEASLGFTHNRRSRKHVVA